MTKSNHDAIAKQMRRDVVEMVYATSGSHIGCSLGIVDILTALYFNVMSIDPKKPTDPKRDRFLLSKGHACVALYAALAARGYFSRNELKNYAKDGSRIAAHSTLGSLPGIEATAGSLGHGLPMGAGLAVAAKNDNNPSTTYVLTGDGECMEGSVWEAVLFAGHHKLDNLVLIVDNNNLITLGNLDQLSSMEPFAKKFESFGWKATTVDGHDVSALTKALTTPHPQQPLAVIAKTTKGKGVSYMENDLIWHGKCPSEEQYLLALKELQ